MDRISELSIEETGIHGCFVLRFPEHRDDRGDFFRKYCEETFIFHGLNSHWVQTNFSSNSKRGTLRGFHFQKGPLAEIKLVTCVNGAVHDAILDLRPDSDTYLKSFSVKLTSDCNTSIYIAKGVAHAYLTLEEDSAVLYQVSENYSKENTSGVRFSDPKVSVSWPIDPKFISSADLSWDLL